MTKSNVNYGVAFRAAAAATIAIGSKAAMLAKSAGGAGGFVKGVGLLAAGGTAAAAASTMAKQDPNAQKVPPQAQRLPPQA